MRRAWLALAVGGLPLWVAAQQREFPSGVAVVRVDAVVLDRDGRSVAGLRASDFELLEDGRPQAITSFEAVLVHGRVPEPVEVPKASRPRPADGALFVLFYDDLHLTPASTDPAREAVRRFLTEAVRPGDRVTIVAPDQDVWWSARLDEGRADLLAVADRLRGRRTHGSSTSDYEALLVRQRGEAGFLDRDTTDAVKGRTTAEAKQEQDNAELQRQIALGRGIIPSPPSTIGGPKHRDLRGLGSPERAAEAAADYADAVGRNRVVLAALRDVASALALVPGRKSLVVVSEGIVDDPELGELAQVVDTSRAANVVLYFLDVRRLVGSGYVAADQKPPPLPVLTLERQGGGIGTERLADETGGRTLTSNDLADGLRQVAAEAHSYYLLGYVPAERRPPAERRIALRVRRPGLSVRTRPAGRTEASIALAAGATSTPAPGPASADTVGAGSSSPGPSWEGPIALDLLARSGADLADVPLALSTYVFDETAPGRARVVVAADLDLPPAKAGTAVRFRTLVVPLAGGAGLQQEGEEALEPSPEPPWTGGFGTHAPLARTFELAPGRYQARLAVEVAGRARRGAATLSFDVPPLAGLRLSSPILTDRLRDRLDRAPRPVVRGLKAFWPKATLYCQFEVYGASGPAAVEAGYTVQDPDGNAVRSAAPTRIQATPNGRLLRLVGFPLAGFSPGVYSLTVDVRDGTSGATVARSDRFRVFDVRR